jgi:hypothetical protein
MSSTTAITGIGAANSPRGMLLVAPSIKQNQTFWRQY